MALVEGRLSNNAVIDPTRALLLRLVTYTHAAFDSREEEIVDDWKIRLVVAHRHSSEVVRAEAHWGTATLAGIVAGATIVIAPAAVAEKLDSE